MKNNDNSMFWHHMPDPVKQPNLIKRILTISLYILGFLIIGFVLIGIFVQPPQQIGDKIKSSPSSSCKYTENNTKNILSLINEYRSSQKLPALTEYPSLNQYQNALLDELQKNNDIKNNELKNIASWQEKNSNDKTVYLENGLREFGVSSFLNPCYAFDFLKNNNKNELSSTAYDSLGIALIGKDLMIIVGKKTDRPNQFVSGNYTNSLASGFKSAREASYAPYIASNPGYTSSTDPINVSVTITNEKSPEDIQACKNYYLGQLENLKANYDADLQSESRRYAQGREQISRDMASRGLTGSGIATQAYKEAATHHQNITNSLKTNYDIQVDSINSRQQSC